MNSGMLSVQLAVEALCDDNSLLNSNGMKPWKTPGPPNERVSIIRRDSILGPTYSKRYRSNLMQLIIISRALVSVDAQEIMYVYICIAGGNRH
jgi:hypothetical protein